MTLKARLTRLEQKHAPGDAYADMSIGQIVATLNALDCEIETSVGMPVAEYADMLAEQIKAGTLEGMDEATGRRFIASVQTPNIEIARELQRENSFYPRFLKGCMGVNGKFVT
ncbi:hypothetical protein ABMA32_03605 [Mesorhizobium sp. VNQ89]|uniref:hypothetical protein n=1 Tax=Mesorhizobium quangtriensis TaxID=3157709 RepID=UPI0032B77CFD